MKRKPVNRDSVQKIQKNIEMTKHNIEVADELIANSASARKDLNAENRRRTEAVRANKKQLKSETTHQKNGYS